MEKKNTISDFRERLDKTLATNDLSNEDSIKILVRNQLLNSSLPKDEGNIEKIVERRTIDVTNFLDMLRSASLNDGEVSKAREKQHADWKLKQDNEEFRVMYREGPQGTPFHSLLVEGYVDAPVDVCLCVSWESILYKKWWPQFSIPTFKIISSSCLQKARIGEQISLVRLKLSWPLSVREAVVHYLEFEYFKDGLVIVLLNSVSDLKSIDGSTHGFTNDGIPEETDVVRIDLVGGFAIQKVSSHRSYFRTITNMDIKLDFIPPSLINFISRQLVGNGFKLYQKAVASVKKGNEDFAEALRGPLYARIREGLYPDIKLKRSLELEDIKSKKLACIDTDEHPENTLKNDTRICESRNPESKLKKALELEDLRSETFEFIATREDPKNTFQADAWFMNQTYLRDAQENEITQADSVRTGQTSSVEIEEEDVEQEMQLDGKSGGMDNSSIHHVPQQRHAGKKNKVIISPEVENALTILDKAISIVREGSSSTQNFLNFRSTNQFQNLEKIAEAGSSAAGKDQDLPYNEVSIETSNTDKVVSSSYTFGNASGPSSVQNSGCMELDSSSKDLNHNRKALTKSPEQNLQMLGKTQPVALDSSHDEATKGAPVPDNTTKDHQKGSSPKENGFHDFSVNGGRKTLIRKRKKQGLFCFRF